MENLYRLAMTGDLIMSNQFCGSLKKYPIKQSVDTKSHLRQVINGIKSDKIRKETGNKTGRNEICPCGSGKKFKKCCGNI